MSKCLQAEHIMREYEDAHLAAHGTPAKISYKHGKIVLNGKVVPMQKVESLATVLWAAVHAKQLGDEQ